MTTDDTIKTGALKPTPHPDGVQLTKSRKRSINSHPMALHVVFPTGHIKQLLYDQNVNGAHLLVEKGSVRFNERAVTEGFSWVKDHYEAWRPGSYERIYLAWYDAVKKGAKTSLEQLQRDGEDVIPPSILTMRESPPEFVPPSSKARARAK